MIVQSGMTYADAKYAKALCVAEAKAGKTVFLVGSILGLLPWQKNGAVVDAPNHLHILTFDQGALTRVREFLVQSCAAPKEALGYNVYNFQDDVRRVATTDEDYNFTLHSEVIATLGKIQEQARRGGVHAVLISSLTRMAEAVQRGLFGPPASRDSDLSEEQRRKRSKGAADENKWVKFAQLVSELRDYAQVDDWHCFWEGHITKSEDADGNVKDSLAIQGKSAANFALNVEQVFRIRRMYNQKFEQSKVDKAYLDTQPSLTFIANGRGFNEALQPQEADLTTALHKLGLKVGQWKPKRG